MTTTDTAKGELLAVTQPDRNAAARRVEGDSDNPLRVAEANAIYDGRRDSADLVQAEARRRLSALQAAQQPGTACGDNQGWLPHQTGSALAFDDGILNLSRDGSATIVFRDEVLEWETDQETGKDYRFARLPASEVHAIRDELNKRFPPAQQPVAWDELVELVAKAIRVKAAEIDARPDVHEADPMWFSEEYARAALSAIRPSIDAAVQGERQACAKIADEQTKCEILGDHHGFCRATARNIATAIRSRNGETADHE